MANLKAIEGIGEAYAAKLLVDLRMRRLRAGTLGMLGRRGLTVAEAAFQEGYGPADGDLLGLLMGMAVVRRGKEMAARLARLPRGTRGPATRLLRFYLSAELGRLGR